jgi:peroxiredoxin
MFCACNWLSAAAYAPTEGALHPDFVLPRIDNREPVALSDYRGKKLLLIQFASW